MLMHDMCVIVKWLGQAPTPLFFVHIVYGHMGVVTIQNK
jgi:hypothetical protein